jgi:HNH endonuclease
MAEVYIPISIQQEVIVLANGYCEYCLYPEKYSSAFFHFDHIISLFEGGTSELSNIARCCGYCNGFKKAKTHHFDPATGKITALFNPRKSLWVEHFQWSDDDLLILGQSDIGRATVELLQLNRQNVVNLRQILKKNREHPPKFSVKIES